VTTTYALIPGAGGGAWYWHLLVDELRARGAEAIAVDLPAADDDAGLPEYADAVVDAIGDRSPVVVVAQSLGGLSAPLVCDRVDVELLVFLNAMIPVPGESFGDWWGNTGQAEARAEAGANHDDWDDDDMFEVFFHDVPEAVRKEAIERGEPPQSNAIATKPAVTTPLPKIPIRVLAGRDDRFFPVAFQRRIAEERLGITPDEMPGGHLLALSRPKELADRLEQYRAELGN
jgi:pimeloyl-ACP methyl ester carboxylesterase